MARCRAYILAAFLALCAQPSLGVAVHENAAVVQTGAGNGEIVDQAWAAQMAADAERLNKMEQEEKEKMLAYIEQRHVKMKEEARRAGVFADKQEHTLEAKRFMALCDEFVHREVAKKAKHDQERRDAKSALHALGLANGTPQMKAVLGMIQDGAVERDGGAFCQEALRQLQSANLEGADSNAKEQSKAAASSEVAVSTKQEQQVEVTGTAEFKTVQQHNAQADTTVQTQEKAGAQTSSETAAATQEKQEAKASATVTVNSKGDTFMAKTA